MLGALFRWLFHLIFPKKPGDRARSSEWHAVRHAYLDKYPRCAACGNDTREDLQVHHKKPFHRHPDLELDEDNLITLCEQDSWGTRNCHFTFGHAYHWHGWNPTVEKDAAAFLAKVEQSQRLAQSSSD